MRVNIYPTMDPPSHSLMHQDRNPRSSAFPLIMRHEVNHDELGQLPEVCEVANLWLLWKPVCSDNKVLSEWPFIVTILRNLIANPWMRPSLTATFDQNGTCPMGILFYEGAESVDWPELKSHDAGAPLNFQSMRSKFSAVIIH